MHLNYNNNNNNNNQGIQIRRLRRASMNRSRMYFYTRISLGCSSNAYPDCS